MRKYNHEELSYFGLSEQELSSGDIYEQNIDKESEDRTLKSKDSLHQYKSTLNKRKFEAASRENGSDPFIGNEEDSSQEESEHAQQNYDDVVPGVLLHTTTDQWHNGKLIPKDTIFTVVTPPKKVRKIKKGEENESTYNFFVRAQTLLETGEAIEIRLNMRNCRKWNKTNSRDLLEDLKW